VVPDSGKFLSLKDQLSIPRIGPEDLLQTT